MSLAGILRRSSMGDDDAQAARATCILSHSFSLVRSAHALGDVHAANGDGTGAGRRVIGISPTSKQVAYERMRSQMFASGTV